MYAESLSFDTRNGTNVHVKRRRQVPVLPAQCRLVLLALCFLRRSSTAWFHTVGLLRQNVGGVCRATLLGPCGTPSSSRLFAKKQKRISLSSQRCLRSPTTSANTASTRTQIQGLVQNLFSVISHIQNPDLYAPKWSDRAVFIDSEEEENQQVLVTSSSVSKGSILSLYPVHALGLRTDAGANNSNNTRTRDFLVFDNNDLDGPYFRTSPVREKDLRVSVPLLLATEPQESLELFVDVNPNRGSHLPGWMGHFVTRSGRSVANGTDGEDQQEDPCVNCIILSLPGVAPLCALVAIRDIAKGEKLLAANAGRYSSETIVPLVQQKYAAELAEIQGYLNMSYPAHLQPVQPLQHGSPTRNLSIESDCTLPPSFNEDDHDDLKKISFQTPFYTININYPGLRYIHNNPDVLVIDDFLSREECEQIMRHAEKHLIPCLVKHPQTGKVMRDPSRTSDNANLPQADVPSIVEKLVQLTQCLNATYLETLQVLRYAQGQHFAAHTDGFDGPTTACGYYQSGRLVTVFCYLNTVPEGGTTVFPKLRTDNGRDVLTIQPRQGMAVVHFPATTGLEEDPRTEHVGSEAEKGHDKWLLTTWVWKDSRTDPQYDESVFPSLLGSGKRQHTLNI